MISSTQSYHSSSPLPSVYLTSYSYCQADNPDNCNFVPSSSHIAHASLLDKLNDLGDNIVVKFLTPYMGTFEEGSIFENYKDPGTEDFYYLPAETNEY